MSDQQIASPLDAVFEDIANGASLVTALERQGMSAPRFYRLVASDVQHGSNYARAVTIRADLLADQIVDIADTEKDAARARNRIDARKWAAAKMNPHKFSDRIDVTVTERVSIADAIARAELRSRPVSDQQDDVTDLVPNESGTYEPRPTDEQSDSASPSIFD